MDIIYIKGMRVSTLIGAYASEQHKKQPVVIDLELGLSDKLKPKADSFESLNLDYKIVGERISTYVANGHFQLLETLADNIYNILKTEFNVPWAKIKISKPKAAIYSDDVGIIIERGKR